jgi:hypothetical protein
MFEVFLKLKGEYELGVETDVGLKIILSMNR